MILSAFVWVFDVVVVAVVVGLWSWSWSWSDSSAFVNKIIKVDKKINWLVKFFIFFIINFGFLIFSPFYIFKFLNAILFHNRVRWNHIFISLKKNYIHNSGVCYYVRKNKNKNKNILWIALPETFLINLKTYCLKK